MKRHLPEAFTEMLRSYGISRCEEILCSLADGEPSVAVRANTRRGAVLSSGLEPVPWLAASGAYLPERPVFASDPAWHQGLYYVQDASSMAFTAIIKELSGYFDNRPLRYLDACAAPGGKTIAACEALPDGSLIVANEYDRSRAGILQENTAKYGYPDIVLTQGDAAAIGALGECFDIIAVDAPCSGEGMFRKEPEAIRQWSHGLIESCASTQRAIVEGVWNALRPGGILIYSTCTFNSAEDEEIVGHIINNLGGESVELACLAEYGCIEPQYRSYNLHGYHFFPGLVRGEGLFVAAIRKHDSSSRPMRKSKERQQKIMPTPLVADFARRHIKDCDRYSIISTGNESYSLIATEHKELCNALVSKLKAIRTGLPLCTVKGKSIIPAWQLAYSTALLQESFQAIELDYAGALRYLHGESLTDIPAGIAPGYTVATHGGIPLGFAKNIGRRANNLLPDGLTLRLEPSKLPSPTPIIDLI